MHERTTQPTPFKTYPTPTTILPHPAMKRLALTFALTLALTTAFAAGGPADPPVPTKQAKVWLKQIKKDLNAIEQAFFADLKAELATLAAEPIADVLAEGPQHFVVYASNGEVLLKGQGNLENLTDEAQLLMTDEDTAYYIITGNHVQ